MYTYKTKGYNLYIKTKAFPHNWSNTNTYLNYKDLHKDLLYCMCNKIDFKVKRSIFNVYSSQKK